MSYQSGSPRSMCVPFWQMCGQLHWRRASSSLAGQRCSSSSSSSAAPATATAAAAVSVPMQLQDWWVSSSTTESLPRQHSDQAWKGNRRTPIQTAITSWCQDPGLCAPRRSLCSPVQPALLEHRGQQAACSVLPPLLVLALSIRGATASQAMRLHWTHNIMGGSSSQRRCWEGLAA
jgi:hypothetical protein